MHDLLVTRAFRWSIVPLLFLSLAVVCAAASGPAKSNAKDAAHPAAQRPTDPQTHVGLVRQQIARQPITFFPISTATPSAAYESHLPGYDLQVRPSGMTIRSQRTIPTSAVSKPAFDDGVDGHSSNPQIIRHQTQVEFLGANPAAHLEALDPARARVNRLIGNDPLQWQHDLPSPLKLLRGITRSAIAYDFIVSSAKRPCRHSAGIITGFEYILRFYKTNGHAPQHKHDGDICERIYAVRLDQLRKLPPEELTPLLPMDGHGLLDGSANANIAESDDSDISVLRLVRSAEMRRDAPEQVADRFPCRDFAKFKPLFRFNNRATKDNLLDDADRFLLALSQVSNRRLTYAELTVRAGKSASLIPTGASVGIKSRSISDAEARKLCGSSRQCLFRSLDLSDVFDKASLS
jgi:hypothetical protein